MRFATVLCLFLALAVPQLGSAQTAGRVTGTVTSAAGAPLPGAQVIVTGTSLGAQTDAQGRYTIDGVRPGSHRLRAEAVGYTAKESPVVVAAGQAATADFSLAPAAVQLEEVVAIGYGTARRRDVTGAVASVSGDQISPKAAPVTAVSNALQGKAPGVQVVTNSGIPGGGASVRVRGTQSITANSEPLYVVDGVPAVTGTRSGDPTQNPLNSINPNDIESVEILKDASSTAIYGARGANGVVLITTKRGRRGESRIQVESSYGIQEITKTYDMLNAQEYATLVNEASLNAGRGVKFCKVGLPGCTSDSPIWTGETYDYQAPLIQTAPQQNHSVSVSGGDERTRFLISGNYLNQEGIVKGADFRRYGARLNLDRDVSERFRVGSTINFSQVNQNISEVEEGGVAAGARGLLAAMQFDPSVPIRTENGWTMRATNMGEQVTNPVATAEELVNQRNQNRLIGNVFGELDLIEGMRFRSSFSANLFNERSPYFAPRTIFQGNSTNGNARIWDGEGRELRSENLLTYGRDLLGNRIDLTGGFEITRNRFQSVQAEAQNLPTDVLGWNNLGSGATLRPASSNTDEWTLISYLGRANYTLADKYVFTATGRFDGSSRFGASNKWGFFPSAAFAWRAIDEGFMRNQGLFSDLKVRLSYGVTGNQEIGLYQSLARMGTVFYGPSGVERVSLAPGDVAPNPDLKWEQTGQFNAGLDMGFLDNRVTLSLDAYTSTTDDLLLSVDLPRTTGFASQLQNIGSVSNRGVELAINTVNFEGDRFGWRSTLNLAANRNEVENLGSRPYILVGAPGFSGFVQGGNSHIVIPGEPLGAFYGFETDGIFQTGESCPLKEPRPGTDCVPGEWRTRDISGPDGVPDGKIDVNYDRTIIGYADPDWYGGFNNSLSYGPLSLDAFFNFSVGNEVVNASMVMTRDLSMYQNQVADAINRWTPENPSETVPRANWNRQRMLHTGLVEDGSYLRLQTLTLGYQLPQSLMRGVDAARIYLTGQNLWLLSDYSGWDPEVNRGAGDPRARGLDVGSYPRARTWNLGVNLTF